MAEVNNQNNQGKFKKDKDVYALVREADEAKKAAKSKKAKHSVFQLLLYYALPLLSIVLFLGIIVFGTMPAVTGINDYIGEREEKEAEIKDLDKQIASLQGLRESEFQMKNDLDLIDLIVPSEKSQVAKFVGEIADLAEKYNLAESDYSSGEQIENLEGDETDEEAVETETASLIRIPTESTYQALFSDIQSFLDALYNKDDFIIVSVLDMQGFRAREIQAEQQQNQQTSANISIPKSDWTMEVTFEKYQFSESFSDYIVNNLVSINTEPDSTTLEFIRERYAR